MKKFLLLATAIMGCNYCNAQSLARTVVGSQGDYFWSPTVSVEWTVGEVMSETFASTNSFLTQGFHQPGYKLISEPEIGSDFFNAFSPNGDGINDWWNIPILNLNPKNSVVIISRWGNELWKKENYDNKNVAFNGDNMSGNPLPDGTYYYIIKYSNIEKRGWLFIKR